MSLKILFMGTPLFAVPILKAINETKNKVLEVYTQPPKKKNRGQKINFSAIHEYSKSINIKVIKDLRNEKIGYKVREHSSAKVSIILALGAREKESRTVSVRRIGSNNTETKSLNDFIADIKVEAISPSS